MSKAQFKSFRTFTEERVKELVTTFGRFSPPTIGHAKLLNAVVELATKGKTYRIYASQTEDNKNNPLNYEDKIKFLRKMFPSYGRNILLDRNIKNVLDIAVKAYNDGFSKFTLVVGSDRVLEFKRLLDKYNGVKAAHGYYDFKDGIIVKSAGERDPDSSDDVEGMSSSKLRTAAIDNDLETFSKGIPTDFSDTKDLFNAVRKGLGLAESNTFKKPQIAIDPSSDQREQYIAGNIFKIGSSVSNLKTPGIRYTIDERYTNFVVCSSNKGGLKSKFFIHDLIEEKELSVIDKTVVRDGGSAEYTFSDGSSLWLDHRLNSKTRGSYYENFQNIGKAEFIVKPTEAQSKAIKNYK